MPHIQQSYRSVFTSQHHGMYQHPLPITAPRAFFVQVHACVTEMSLEGKTLQPWETCKHHPVATVPVETSKRPQTRSLQAPSKRRSRTPAASKPAQAKPSNKTAAGRSNQKQRSLSVALHANASSILPNEASPIQSESCPEPAAQQAASEFTIGNIHAVLAVGTSGPDFHARYSHRTSTVLQTLNLLRTYALSDRAGQ